MVLMITFPTQRCVWIMTPNCVIRLIMLVLLAKRILLDITSQPPIGAAAAATAAASAPRLGNPP